MKSRYLITGTTTPEFASAMLSKPQNRLDVVKPFFDQVGMEIIDMFYTSSTDPNMFVICASDSDSKVEALKNIVYATGTYRRLSWSRIYSASEYKEVYDYGHDVMADYVSALAASEE